MADQTVRGRFVWHDLLTPDTAGAHAFYSKVLGWKSQPWEQDPSYTLFVGPNGPLGGTMAQPAGPSQWLHYIGTPDIDATVQQAKRLGARVTQEITTVVNGGKYAMLTDPQGAAFAVYESPTPMPAEQPPEQGEFSWHELATTDWKAALEFYSALFGWEKLTEHDMGEMGAYVEFGSEGVHRGGMFNKPAHMQGPPAWLGYVRVPDVNRAVKKVKSARGTLLHGPAEVPGGDWIVQFVDQNGAAFAVHTIAADLSAGKGAPAAPAKKAGAKKPAAKKAGAEQPAATKAGTKQAGVKKAGAKKAGAKKAAVKKPAAKQVPARKKGAAKKKQGAAAKAAKRPARKAAKVPGKKAAKKVAGRGGAGKKKVAKQPRKAK